MASLHESGMERERSEREAASTVLSVSISDTGEVAIGNSFAFGGKGGVIVYQYSYDEDCWESKGQWLEGEHGENFGTTVSLSGDGTRLVVVSGWLGEPVDPTAFSPVRVYGYDKSENLWIDHAVRKETDTVQRFVGQRVPFLESKDEYY